MENTMNQEYTEHKLFTELDEGEQFYFPPMNSIYVKMDDVSAGEVGDSYSIIKIDPGAFVRVANDNS
jgi:hypothetical protein